MYSIGPTNKLKIMPTNKIICASELDPEFITENYHSRIVMAPLQDELGISIIKDDSDIQDHLNELEGLNVPHPETLINEGPRSIYLKDHLDSLNHEFNGSKAEIFEALFNSVPYSCNNERETFVVKGRMTGEYYLVELKKETSLSDPITEVFDTWWEFSVRKLF